jgi:hypothetical protein
MPALTTIQLRRGTTAEWSASTNPLALGEVGYDTSLKKFKIGDGTSLWDSLGWGTVLPTEFNESIDDRVSALLVAGSNITLSYNDSANTLTISASTSLDTESVQDIIGDSIIGGSGISVSYDDAGTGKTTISLSDPTIQTTDITDFAEGVDDRVSNLLIAGSGISLSYDDPTNKLTISLGSHTHILSAITDVTATASEVNALDLTTGPGTAEASKAVVLDSNKDISGIRNISATSLTLSGNLTVNGSVTTINSTTITVDDKNLELGSVASPTDESADGGGLTLKGTTDKEFKWIDSTDSWTSSEHLDLASGKVLKINGVQVLSASQYVGNSATVTNGVYTTDTGTVTNTMLAGSIANNKLVNSKVTIGSTDINLGGSATTISGLSSVTSTSFVGALTGNASTATKLATARTINGTSFDGSANIVIASIDGGTP